MCQTDVATSKAGLLLLLSEAVSFSIQLLSCTHVFLCGIPGVLLMFVNLSSLVPTPLTLHQADAQISHRKYSLDPVPNQGYVDRQQNLWTRRLSLLSLQLTTATAVPTYEPRVAVTVTQRTAETSQTTAPYVLGVNLGVPIAQPTLSNTRKTAFLIAQKRAALSGQTQYRGRTYTAAQLQCLTTPGQRRAPATAARTASARPRMPFMIWNCGGLTSVRFKEIRHWIAQHPPMLIVLLETFWKDDLEWFEPGRAGGLSFIHTGSAMTRSAGILAIIPATFAGPQSIQYDIRVPGRLMHIRLLGEPSTDLIACYQHTWYYRKEDKQSLNARESLLTRREAFLQSFVKVLKACPLRNGLLVVGDWNTSLPPEPNVVGTGVPASSHHPVQTDASMLLQVLKDHALTCLNTWGRRGPSSRTFHLSAASTHGSLIDFAITRQCSADGISRQTRPLPASDLVTTKGMYHLPLRGSIARPHVPRTPPRPYKVPSVSQVHMAFASDPERLILFRHQVEQQLRHTEHPDELNGVMLQAWRIAAPDAAGGVTYPTRPTYSTQIQEMWHIRRRLRFCQQGHSTLAGMFRSWVQVKRLQIIQRAIAKEARARKKQALTNFLNEIDTPEYSNRMSRLFKAVKRFAPKTKKQRIQLKDELGHLLTPSDAAQAYSTFFHELYQSPAVPPDVGVLTEDLGLSWAEWFSALAQTQARKAVPSHYAPALLWKHCADLLAHFIAPRASFPAGPIEWPETWTDAFLALLPKPPKPPSHPKALRPISLLDPLSKSLGVILAQRLGPYTRHYLDTQPQHAYLAQRSTASAISKVMSHCH